MKKFFSLLCTGLMLIACTSNKQSFGSKELQGTYEIDFSSLLSELNTDNEKDAMAAALAAILLSQMEMTMQFDGDQLKVDGSGSLRDLISIFGSSGAQMPFTIEYEIRNDSVLYTSFDGEDYSKAGVLRKVDDTYDTLRLVVEEEGEESILTLRKKVQ